MASARRATWWSAVVLGALVLGGYLAHAWLYRAYLNDDAFITFRYSRFLAEGRGPYFNVGEHVEGYTNFLLMLVMAGVIKLLGTGPVLSAARLINLAGGLLALVATWGLCRRWLHRLDSLAPHADRLAWLAPALVAANAAFAVNSMSGLETALFSGCLMLGLWLLQAAWDTQRWHGAGLAFALAALTRPEGAGAFAAAWAGTLLAGGWKTSRARRLLLIDAVVVALAVAGHLTFRYHCYDGELLPNTYYAKTGGASPAHGPLAYLFEFGWYHLGGVPALVGLLPFALPHSRLRRAGLPALLVIGLAVAVVFRVGTDWMIGYRLLVPYAPLWAALMVCGLAVVAYRTEWSTPRVTAGAGVLVLAALLFFQYPMARSYADQIRLRARGYREGHLALAGWLNEHARPGETVALMDIGMIGFHCPQLRILDITGLTDRTIAKAPGDFLHKDYDPAYVLEQKPEYIVIVATDKDGQGWRGNPQNLVAWTPMEARISRSDFFRRHYFRPRPIGRLRDEYERLAARRGAERVFPHSYPGRSYLLFLYTYRP